MAPSPEFEREFREIFALRSGPLFRYVSRLVGDEALAADVTQESFVKLYERGSVPDDVRGWLGTVATNLVRDEERTRRRRASLTERADIPVAEAEPADAATLRAEARERVQRALRTLPERSRVVLLLRYEGFSYREIAGVLGVPERNVGTLLARASTAFGAAYRGLDVVL